jgi:hypothetical protein
MNYKNKIMLYKVENNTVKYLNFSCADTTKTNKLKNYWKIKTHFLQPIQDDQLRNDYQVGVSTGPEWLQSGSWWSHYCWRLVLNFNLTIRPGLLHM